MNMKSKMGLHGERILTVEWASGCIVGDYNHSLYRGECTVPIANCETNGI